MKANDFGMYAREPQRKIADVVPAVWVLAEFPKPTQARFALFFERKKRLAKLAAFKGYYSRP
jgi:hypothetical protein